MKDGLVFWYDNICSTDMGLMNVSIESGMISEVFLSDREISEVESRYKDKPVFQGLSLSPIEFDLTFAFVDGFDNNKLREVARWLFSDSYKPFYTDNNLNRIFYCVAISDSSLIHNGIGQGYVTVKFRCDSPYSYSPYYESEEYVVLDRDIILVENMGDVDIFPELLIRKAGAGDVSIKNLSYEGKLFSISNLADGEIIYLNMEDGFIKSNLTLSRYEDFFGQFFLIRRGINRLEVIGSCSIKTRCRFKTLQG